MQDEVSVLRLELKRREKQISHLQQLAGLKSSLLQLNAENKVARQLKRNFAEIKDKLQDTSRKVRDPRVAFDLGRQLFTGLKASLRTQKEIDEKLKSVQAAVQLKARCAELEKAKQQHTESLIAMQKLRLHTKQEIASEAELTRAPGSKDKDDGIGRFEPLTDFCDGFEYCGFEFGSQSKSAAASDQQTKQSPDQAVAALSYKAEEPIIANSFWRTLNDNKFILLDEQDCNSINFRYVTAKGQEFNLTVRLGARNAVDVTICTMRQEASFLSQLRDDIAMELAAAGLRLRSFLINRV